MTFRISKKEAIMIIAFISAFLPGEYALPNILYQVWKIARLGISYIAILLVLREEIRGMKFRYAIMLLYYAWLYIGTWLLSPSGTLSPVNFLQCIGFISLFELFFREYSPKEVLKAFVIAGLFVSLLHFASFVLYADVEGGMRGVEEYYSGDKLVTSTGQNWFFLTYDNMSVFYFLPIAAAMLCYGWTYNKKVLTIFWLYVSFICYMYIAKNAATAMVSMFLFVGLVLCCLLAHRKKQEPRWMSFLNYKNSLLAGISANIVVVILVGGNIAAKIASIFGKTGTFSGRGSIWSKSLQYITEHFLFGNGIEETSITWDKIGQSHTHNLLLEHAYLGGIIAVVLFVLVLWYFRPRNNKSFTAQVVAVSMFVYFVAASFDWLESKPYPMALLYFSYFLGDCNAQQNRIAQTGEIVTVADEER